MDVSGSDELVGLSSEGVGTSLDEVGEEVSLVGSDDGGSVLDAVESADDIDEALLSDADGVLTGRLERSAASVSEKKKDKVSPVGVRLPGLRPCARAVQRRAQQHRANRGTHLMSAQTMSAYRVTETGKGEGRG